MGRLRCAIRGGAGRDERGETLLELLISVTLIGIAVVAVFGGLTTGIVMSDIHRKQATAGTVLHNYAEAVQNMVAAGGYHACTSTSADETAYAPSVDFKKTVPAGYTPSVVSVSMRYWDGSKWNASCGSDTGLQRLTLEVRSDDGRATERLVIVVRKPCGLGDTLCG